MKNSKKIIGVVILTLAMSTTVLAGEKDYRKGDSNYFMMSSDHFSSMLESMKDFGMSEHALDSMKDYMDQDNRSFGHMMNFLDDNDLEEMYNFMNSSYNTYNYNSYSTKNKTNHKGWSNMNDSYNGYNCHGNSRY